VAALAALYGLRGQDDMTIGAAYAAFTAALVVWGWQEMAFLLGYVTGPRRLPCPSEAQGWRRVGLALQVIAHHEIALLLLGAALLWLGPSVALWTFVSLWALRQSAKLNVFLGVRNLNEHFLPAHVAYLHSYFRQRPMNRLFPLSVLLASAAAWWLWQAALAGGLGRAEETGLVLVATIVTLGLLEHWLMVLPLPSHQLWAWGMRSRSGEGPG
jgi:putative photosynthetic complex assembly protein 2